jgi:hypothetical protein
VADARAAAVLTRFLGVDTEGSLVRAMLPVASLLVAVAAVGVVSANYIKSEDSENAYHVRSDPEPQWTQSTVQFAYNGAQDPEAGRIHFHHGHHAEVSGNDLNQGN